MALEVAAELKLATELWIKNGIKTPAEAIAVNEFDAKLLKIRKGYDRARDDEKRPHDDAAKAVQRRWLPILTGLDSCRNSIASLLRDWKLAEQARIDAARNAAKRAAEEKRRAAEEATAKAAQKPTIDTLTRSMEAASAAAEAERTAAALPERARIPGGMAGRATGLRSQWVATQIVDFDQCVQHYRSNARLLDLLLRLAQAEVRAGARDVPGVEIQEEFV